MTGRRIAGAAGGALVAGWALPALSAHLPILCSALGVTRTHEGPGVLLTFDDGPHPEGTPAVLDALARHEARAVFFVVGEQLVRHPGVAEEIVAAGHELAVHGERHRPATLRVPHVLRADLDRATERVGALSGRAPLRYRPPFGIVTPALAVDVRRRGLELMLWSAWGRDWRRSVTPAQIAARVLRDVSPGAIVLLHDSDAYSADGSWRRTAAALPRVLDGLAERGLSLAAPRPW